VILSCRERGMLGSGAVRDVSLVGENWGAVGWVVLSEAAEGVEYL
jgi:hypothetical protein